MRVWVLLILVGMSGCSWFHRRPAPPPPSPELIVTGAPLGSFLLIDGAQVGPAIDKAPEMVRVSPGSHTLEVTMGDRVTYRETFDVDRGEKRVINVLSGKGP